MHIQFADYGYDENEIDGNSNPNGPKFEDFLGCYSNSSEHQNKEINMNMPPPKLNSNDIIISNTNDDHQELRNNNFQMFQPYDYSLVTTMMPSQAAFGSGVSGFRTWLPQVDKPAAESSSGGDRFDLDTLSLTVYGGAQPGDGRKRAMAKGGAGKEPAARKSIDTFGQRTSQFRGVTRSFPFLLVLFTVSSYLTFSTITGS